MVNVKKKKVFVSINLDNKTKKFLSNKVELLKQKLPWINWSDVDKHHLTVLFLGHLDDQEIADICLSMREAFEGNRLSCDVCLNELTWMNNSENARMLWLRGERSEKLQKIRELVERACLLVDYKREVKGFKPHLTLGRFKVRKIIESDQQLLQKESFSLSVPVESVELMESCKEGKKWLHRVLDSFPLD